ncbi:hypothetical protein F0562_013329 [Nyssa sinensis]|uniref:Uncharacterized protein n=1 Tax=Nyssa sinensis TaxID=561372 RepID=A0A5J4ZJY8_9ASTE|nr:hypothetical protein F0562_013329 [Nyssa sinensis]
MGKARRSVVAAAVAFGDEQGMTDLWQSTHCVQPLLHNPWDRLCRHSNDILVSVKFDGGDDGWEFKDGRVMLTNGMIQNLANARTPVFTNDSKSPRTLPSPDGVIGSAQLPCELDNQVEPE